MMENLFQGLLARLIFHENFLANGKTPETFNFGVIFQKYSPLLASF